jgi:hypothetical protein
MLTIDEMVDISTGYANGFDRVLAKTGMTESELTDTLLDNNIEKCPHCGWFTESCWLTDDEEGEVDGYCDNCR